MIRPRGVITHSPAGTERAEDWRDEAACRQADPWLFHVPGDTKSWSRNHAEQIAEARAVCDTCPVVAECLQWALDTNDVDGFLGGLTPDERRALKARNRKRGNVTHCKRGLHELAGDNLGVYGKNNERRCRACMADTRKKDTA